MSEHAATIPEDLPCVGCGYNLRTLAIDGLCPECGLAVGVTVDNRHDPSRIARLRGRERTVVALLWTQGIQFAALAWFYLMALADSDGGLAAPCLIVALEPICLILTAHLQFRLSNEPPGSRLVWLLTFVPLAVVVVIVAFMAAINHPGAMTLTAILALPAGRLGFLSGLLRRIVHANRPEYPRRLATIGRWLGWSSFFLTVSWAVAMGFMDRNIGPGPGAVARGPWVQTILNAALPVMHAMLLIVVFRAARLVKRQSPWVE